MKRVWLWLLRLLRRLGQKTYHIWAMLPARVDHFLDEIVFVHSAIPAAIQCGNSNVVGIFATTLSSITILALHYLTPSRCQGNKTVNKKTPHLQYPCARKIPSRAR